MGDLPVYRAAVMSYQEPLSTAVPDDPEARSADASLGHPSVVQVYRLGRLPDRTLYLVMRFATGRTMEERLKAEGRIPPAAAKEGLHDIASDLAAAHAAAIVHSDVRPANVFWDEEGQKALLAAA